MAKGSHAASPGLNGVPAPPCAHFLAWKPFAINAAPIDYLDTLHYRHTFWFGLRSSISCQSRWRLCSRSG